VSIPGLVVHIQQRKVAPQKLPEKETPQEGWCP
jgi:hypothetical protein